MTIDAFCQYLLISISNVDSNTEILTVLGNFLFGHLLSEQCFTDYRYYKKKQKYERNLILCNFKCFPKDKELKLNMQK